MKSCVSGGGGCLRTSAVQRKFVRLTILLRISTWWNQGLFYWYEELFISDIIELCYEIQAKCFNKVFLDISRVHFSPAQKPGKKKKQNFHQTKKQTKKINNSCNFPCNPASAPFNLNYTNINPRNLEKN